MSSADSASLFRGVMSSTVYFSCKTAQLAHYYERQFAKIHKKTFILTSSVGEAGSPIIHANIDAFR